MGMILRVIKKLKETLWRYDFSKSDVRVIGSAQIAKDVIIKKSSIYVDSTSKLIIENGCKLDGVTLSLTNGASLIIGRQSILVKERNFYNSEYIVDSGTVKIDHHVLLQLQRLWVRFGGVLRIGSYTNLNYGSEIRCDERVEIGKYCMISYNVRIWDTNTHCKMNVAERRALAEKYFPALGMEVDKPKTAPVVIGDDCWLGEYSTILKGSSLSNGVTVGYRTTISNLSISENQTVVSNLNYCIL